MRSFPSVPGFVLAALAVAAGPTLAATPTVAVPAPASATAIAAVPEPMLAPADTGDASSIGRALDTASLDELRGGDGTTTNNVDLLGRVDGNTAQDITSGANVIQDGAFGNSSGISTVIQNSGSNVLIQNGMVVNVQFVDPTP